MRRRGFKKVCLAPLFSLFLITNPSLAQEKGGRDSGPSKTVPKAGSTRAPRRPAPKPKLATLTVTIFPADSLLFFDDQQSESVDASGIAKLTSLKVGQHSLTVRKPGYRERQQIVDLKAGENEPVSITLELLKGTLSVSPGVTEAEISVKSMDSNQGVGTYTGSINQVDFQPGEYEITVSKKGHKSVTRRFTIKPAESVYLEPQLEPLPVEKARTTAMSGSLEVDGKYLIVHLRGTSGDTSLSSGTIAISANKATPQVVYVTGNLPGSPCQVDLVRIDNVSESSLIEIPSASNGWSRIVVRVRPKDSKKTAHFAINWRLHGPSIKPTSRPGALNFVEAIPIEKVRPPFPSGASNSQTGRTVSASLWIDSRGEYSW